MLPATVIVPILASVVRMLAGGSAPTQAEWNNQVTGVLAALLAQRDETNATLSRIEEKLDGLALQDFKHSYGTALNLLEQASLAHREPTERDRMLAAARDQLGRALVATDDPLARATTEWYLGIAWLLSRSKQDCDLAMRRAADYCFEALVQASNEWSLSPGAPRFAAEVKKLETGIDRLGQLLVGHRSERIDAAARNRLRTALVPRVREADATFRAIRDTRRTLGTSAAECPPVRLWPPFDPNPMRMRGLPETPPKGTLKLIVDLEQGEIARLGQYDIGVPTVRTTPAPQAPAGETLVDSEIALACRSGGEQRFELLGLDEEQIEYSKASEADLPLPRLREDLYMSLNGLGRWKPPPSGETAPSLPGRALMADGSFYPKQGTVRLKPGQSARGWVRFGIRGQPAAIAIKLEGEAKHAHFIRSLSSATDAS